MAALVFRNGSPHAKLHVLQETTNNNNNNTTNIDQQPKGGRDVTNIAKKKKTPSQPPQAISVTSLINDQNIQSPKLPPPGRRQQAKKEPSARVHNPPPIAVARRNARERNRVKQVNNGFATLRQHIPNEIAEIYENANNNRTANKKLSKVETLRMAVEYIRSLENLLSIDDGREYKENANHSLASFPSPASSESLQNNSSYEQSYFMQSPTLEDEDDMESNPATPLPPVATHHYSRIPGTNAFQLIPGPAPTLSFEDEENVHPLTPNSDLLPQEDMMIQPTIMTTGGIEYIQEFAAVVQQQQQQQQMLSPTFYSESSLSPVQNGQVDIKYLIPPSGPMVYQTQLVIEQPMLVPGDSQKDIGDVALKKEPTDLDGSFQHDEEMDDVMTWWETEGRHEDESS